MGRQRDSGGSALRDRGDVDSVVGDGVGFIDGNARRADGVSGHRVHLQLQACFEMGSRRGSIAIVQPGWFCGNRSNHELASHCGIDHRPGGLPRDGRSGATLDVRGSFRTGLVHGVAIFSFHHSVENRDDRI